MMKRLLVILSFFVLIAQGSAVSARSIAVDLAEDHVDITTGFDGAQLKLFGVRDDAGDVAIVIMGPKKDMVVRKKEKVFGVWTNLKSMRFENVPLYYDYALSDPSMEQRLPEIMKAHNIGLSSLRFPTKEKEREVQIKSFEDALLRNKQSEQRFPEEPEAITFIKDNFFKTSFYIPSNVPTGDYKIFTYLFQEDVLVDQSVTDIRVGQVGLSAGINQFANKRSMIYGMGCVAFAMIMGWISTLLRRRV